MSLYKGTTLISGAIPDMANQSLSNLNSAGQDKFDAKVDLDLTNVNNVGYIKMAGASMPSNRYIDLTLGASGSEYTAPVSGWVSAMCTNSNMCNLYSRYVTSVDYQDGSSKDRYATIPIAKGAKFKFHYNGTICYFRIICSIGSESEAQ